MFDSKEKLSSVLDPAANFLATPIGFSRSRVHFPPSLEVQQWNTISFVVVVIIVINVVIVVCPKIHTLIEKI